MFGVEIVHSFRDIHIEHPVFMFFRLAMLSQVVTAQKILNRDKQAESTATKILIQMATKLGACPWLVKIPPKGKNFALNIYDHFTIFYYKNNELFH